MSGSVAGAVRIGFGAAGARLIVKVSVAYGPAAKRAGPLPAGRLTVTAPRVRGALIQ